VVDLNHLLLFIACLSPLVLLARTRRHLGMHRTWRLAAFAVLIVTGITWIFWPHAAGYIGGGAWFFLLLIPAVGLRKLREWIPLGRYRCARRLAVLLQWVHPSSDLREIREAIDLRLNNGTDGHYAEAVLRSWAESTNPEPPAPSVRRAQSHTPAVFLFIFLNVAMFGAEFTMGGTTDPETLHRLGALEWYPVLARHEYWRLVTALFLHYGPLHLLFNLYALYVVGPPLEQVFGSVRFAVCYLVAGIGSTGGVLLLLLTGLTRADQLVGASGCVMGIIGASAGLLVRHRHSPMAARRLQNVVLIVAVQVVFDLSTPQVSMGAHLCGLASGFVAGLILAPRRLF
jgi:membrane associated rhomboid family serine protease